MAGNSAAVSVEGIVYIAINSFFHSTLTFTSQNYGAHNFKRMKKGFIISMATSIGVGIVISIIFTRFSGFFLSFYTDTNIVKNIGMMRMKRVCSLYFLCGLMEVAAGGLRGMGVAVRSMLTCVVGVCLVRVIAVTIGAPYNEVSDLNILYSSYPVSWVITTTILTSFFFAILKNREKRFNQEL